MKRKTYLIVLYSSIALSVLGLALFIEEVIRTKNISVFSSIGIALFLLGIITIIINQCFYRIKKEENDLPTSKIKVCQYCNTPNDPDAEYCKICGKKFKNF